MQPAEVHEFWFAGAEHNAALAADRMDFWFKADPSTDAAIAERFAGAIEAAAGGDYSQWAATPAGCLALILVLDQFPRNLYRGTAAAFQNDALAFGLTVVGQRLDFLSQLSPIEQVFFLMPYQHIEDLQRQREGVALYTRLAATVSSEWQSLITGCRDFAQLHCDLIERFGRFPHRNAVLGRTSNSAELLYLQDGESFGQG